ncbi:MAG: pyridoxal-phosphate dependent enzyme [Candidatus Kariarchaeaceae archaeon]|jgi:cysteine synthase
MIDLSVSEHQLENAIQQARTQQIILPTFSQMKNPKLIPPSIMDKLKNVGLWDFDPLNLFRITWKNQAVERGGEFSNLPNYIELPSELTGVKARIICLVGKWFPTGAHKVGAAYGCLIPRLVTGQFDPATHQAAWPSTGNYCRGGAFDSKLLGVHSIAILPEGMSKERFDWLETVATEIIATPGSESNVKEIYDKCHELEATRENVVILNQFDEFGNHLWHYEVTGNAIHEILQKELNEGDQLFGSCFTTGSAGTIGAGDFLKDHYPTSKIAAGEALQCPTLLTNGYGAHRIEGIGDKHVPWIHNVRNTDMVIAIDDNDPIDLIRLFNEPNGRAYLQKQGIPEELIDQLGLMGISSIANVLCCIKMAKYYDLDENDVLVTVWTDSMDLYQSRLQELTVERGEYTENDASIDFHKSLLGIKTDYMEELTYQTRKRIHHLKYFTWVEQQGKDVKELDQQWYDKQYWKSIHKLTPHIDALINSFNEKVGLL